MRKSPVLSALCLAVMACGSNEDGTGSTAAGTGTAGGATSSVASSSASTTGAGGAGGSTSGSCLACSASQGCLRVVVTRTADDSNQPWKVWPMEVDGVGTLVVTAQASGGDVRKTLDGADLKPASASVPVDLGCVAAGAATVYVFLDDNGNAAPTATISSDYRDSCGSPRSLPTMVIAGQSNELTFALANSCD